MIQEHIIKQVQEAERKALSNKLYERVAGLNFINGMVQGAYYAQSTYPEIYQYLNERLTELLIKCRNKNTMNIL
jgi:hypothetical protein